MTFKFNIEMIWTNNIIIVALIVLKKTKVIVNVFVLYQNLKEFLKLAHKGVKIVVVWVVLLKIKMKINKWKIIFKIKKKLIKKLNKIIIKNRKKV